MVLFPHHSYTLKPVTLAPQRATSVDLITFSSYKNNVLSECWPVRRLAVKPLMPDHPPEIPFTECVTRYLTPSQLQKAFLDGSPNREQYLNITQSYSSDLDEMNTI